MKLKLLFAALLVSTLAGRAQTNTNAPVDPVAAADSSLNPREINLPEMKLGAVHARVLAAAGLMKWPTPPAESPAGVMGARITKMEAAGTPVSDGEYMQFLNASKK